MSTNRYFPQVLEDRTQHCKIVQCGIFWWNVYVYFQSCTIGWSKNMSYTNDGLKKSHKRPRGQHSWGWGWVLCPVLLNLLQYLKFESTLYLKLAGPTTWIIDLKTDSKNCHVALCKNTNFVIHSSDFSLIHFEFQNVSTRNWIHVYNITS